jgi:hypothetical protein
MFPDSESRISSLESSIGSGRTIGFTVRGGFMDSSGRDTKQWRSCEQVAISDRI